MRAITSLQSPLGAIRFRRPASRLEGGKHQPPVKAKIEVDFNNWEAMQINLGCGFVTPPGWVNVDGSLGARVAKAKTVSFLAKRLGLIEGDWDPSITIQNLNHPLRFASSSASAIYFSHTLEHLSEQKGRLILGECRRVLQPGGVLRVVVPNLATIVSKYLSGALVATDFLSALHVLYPEHPGAAKRLALKIFSFPHKCMYDLRSLSKSLRDSGFTSVQERKPFESAITNIWDVERRETTSEALIIEATRPND